jgi:hypothetical protein
MAVIKVIAIIQLLIGKQLISITVPLRSPSFKLTVDKLKKTIFLQPIMSGATTLLTDDSLLGSLFFFDKVNTRSFVRKLINKIYNINSQFFIST